MTPDYPRPHYETHSRVIETLPGGQKVKIRVPRMRACDERNEKDKLCLGHIKRWYGADTAFNERFGPEIYRCERCHTLYLPNPDELPRTKTLQW